MEYTINVSDEQNAVLEWLAKTSGGGASVSQFLQAQVNALLQPYQLRFREAENAELVKLISALTDPAIRAQVLALVKPKG